MAFFQNGKQMVQFLQTKNLNVKNQNKIMHSKLVDRKIVNKNKIRFFWQNKII